MKHTDFLCLFVFAILTSTCSERKNNEIKNQIIIQSTSYKIVDDVEPPPPNVPSNGKNLEEWLANICDGEKPKKLITSYDIGVFETTDSNTIYLVGINSLGKGDTSYIKNEFQPTNMYFKLPSDEYKNLSRRELFKELIIQLQAFTTSQKFKSSFLSEADSITFNPDGRIIWSK